MTSPTYQDLRLSRGLKLPGADRHILLQLALAQNDKTEDCFVSINTLAEWTGESRKTITRALGRLKAVGVVSVSNQTRDGKQISNRYKILWKRLRAVVGKDLTEILERAAAAPKVPGRGAVMAQEGGHGDPHNDLPLTTSTTDTIAPLAATGTDPAPWDF